MAKKKAEIWEELVYRWSCPGCGEFNEDDCEPDDTVVCDNCGEEFEADTKG